ncbi:barstar family protein [Streptomyces gobiensis]|uniref:barstar family protein n=1 Tax=Streptomyces gobiensis TaxID=2875706 RepID=UPI001E549B3D|nr:barstar family protein [Streptomyces gobiensis]UGY90624.1 barstar family protein [Streptomyces gobiensis]
MTSPVYLPELPDTDLSGVFDGSVPPGIYRWQPAAPDTELPEMLGAAGAAGWHSAAVDLGGVRDKAAFLDRCARALALPDWFGHNWDALADSLTDLSWWGEPRGYLLVTRDWDGFEQAAPGDATTAAEVLAAASGYWSAREIPMTALLG